MNNKLKISDEFIQLIYGYTRINDNNIIFEIAKTLNKSSQSVWRYIRENRENGPLTTIAVNEIFKKYFVDKEIYIKIE